MRIPLFCLCILLIGSCTTPSPESVAEESIIEAPPEWAKEVVWYQIFVERFRNGDPSNDPTISDIDGSYPGFIPTNWALTPWTQDWYKADPYFSQLEGITDPNGNPVSNFGQRAQLRRYGGDLQGVMDQLDYLDSLGVTAIYFNPINDAPSLHKYDAKHWRHVDRNFGPTPLEDGEIMAREIPDDPSTWELTGADRLFIDLLAAFHQRGIRVILDFSWNHMGHKSWALQDVAEHGEASRFADWFFIDAYDDPNTPENEFAYQGWLGVSSLPELREDVRVDHSQGMHAYEGDIYSPAAKQHIFNVTQRWLDPNGDGDPSDGVDGFRLDVAAEVGLGFWRDYREFVRSINPEAYLVGEIWWESFPHKLLDPEPYLKGDVFDAVMNYRWYRSSRHFFAQAPDKIPVSTLVDSLNRFTSNIRPENTYAMMNLTASHDTPRVLTSLFNSNLNKYNARPQEDENYKIHRPDEKTHETLRLLLAQQFTYMGAPHIWAGDEMGMWGADDPSTRKPLIWPDYEFEPESTHPLDLDRPTDDVTLNRELFAYYQQLIQIRNSHPALVHGDIEYVVVDDVNEILAYSRTYAGNEVIAVFNASTEAKTVEIPVGTTNTYRDALENGEVVASEEGVVEITLPARRASILLHD